MITITTAETFDAEAILALQKLAHESEARLYNDWSIPPLTQSLESLVAELRTSLVLKATLRGQLVGSVRAKVVADVCTIGRLIVLPSRQRQGIGSRLLREAEVRTTGVSKYKLLAVSKSESNIRMYQRHGYKITRTQVISPAVSLTFLEKPAAA